MGLLTNPSSSVKKSKFAKILIKINRLLCFLLYIAGILWFCALGHSDMNNATYFSENALLPGLVYSEIKMETTNYALNLMDELLRERETHTDGMPYAWLLAKMHQIGLDTHTHNFSLHYPFGGVDSGGGGGGGGITGGGIRKPKIFKGKNVYGILRAPRIGSTESIVITAPYRPPNSIQTEITHSIPILLAFASFARKQKYWAKDIIFLITEQEQLGMQAWLDAYQGAEKNEFLQSGTLEARAGSIQAAINLELQSFKIDFIDVKVEGLNGQLPNLDLFNLIQRLALKEGLPSGHKQTSTVRRMGVKSSIEDNLKHMLAMMFTQSTGVPNGNHGLFHRFGIEALTLEAYAKRNVHQHHQHNANSDYRSDNDVSALLKMIEGISRSLNNLLERFHQSFFFYLLVASDRFVSIGDYMPCLGLMAGSLLINAFILWLQLNRTVIKDGGASDDNKREEKHSESESITTDKIDKETNVVDERAGVNETIIFPIEQDFNFLGIGKLLIGIHAIGFLTLYLPFISAINHLLFYESARTEMSLFYIFFSVNLIALIIPYYIKLNRQSIEILHIAALLELGTTLIIVGMLNFSLGFILSVCLVPFAILVNPYAGISINITRVLGFLLNPLMAIFLATTCFTKYSFDNLTFMDLLGKSWAATIDAITFAVVDSIIYSNWLYDLVTVILLPIWILFWCVLFTSHTSMTEQQLNVDEIGPAAVNVHKKKIN